MNAQDLKNSILQLAIQGNLVEQREEEGTVKELLEHIKLEKEMLIKEGKIKKEKPLQEITEDEIPFEIPESWEWVRLGRITHNWGQKVPDKLFDYIDVASIDNINGCLGKDENLVQASDAPSRARKIVREGSVLYSTVRPYLLNICIVDKQFKHEPIASTAFAVLHPYQGIFEKYLYHVLRSPMFVSYVSSVMIGVAYPAINDANLLAGLIPLPPLEEQKRIVAKIEELIPYVEKYGEAHSKLELLNKKFPENMQKSILQYAIQGKLVEQREEEGIAEDLYQQIQEEKAKLIKEGKIKKEKPLPEIIDDEIPFEIPDSWKWARFGDIMINRDAERIPLSVSERESLEKIYDYYGASGVIDKVDKYIFDKKLLLIGEDGANLLTRSKPIAFLAVGKYWVNNHAHVIDCGENICIEYVMYYINAISLAKYVTGTAQPKMNQAKLNSIPVPLPPLAEQKRIVAKIEELIPYCQQLIK